MKNKFKVQAIENEVDSTLIKLRTSPRNPFNIREKTTIQRESGNFYRRAKTRSQETPELITPIPSSIVNVEESH